MNSRQSFIRLRALRVPSGYASPFPRQYFSEQPSDPESQKTKSDLLWGAGSLLGSGLLYNFGWKKTAILPMIFGAVKVGQTVFKNQINQTIDRLDRHVDGKMVTYSNIGSSLRARVAASSLSKDVYNPDSTMFGISDVDFGRATKQGGKRKYPFEVTVEFVDQGTGKAGELKGFGTFVDDNDYFFTSIYIDVSEPEKKKITILEEQEIIDL